MEIGSHGKGVHKQAEEPIQREESRIHTMGFLSIAIEESFRLRKQEIAKKQQAMVNESVKLIKIIHDVKMTSFKHGKPYIATIGHSGFVSD